MPLHFSNPGPYLLHQAGLLPMTEANGGFTRVWPPFTQIGLCWILRPFTAFFTPLTGGSEQHLENPDNASQWHFSSDILGFA